MDTRRWPAMADACKRIAETITLKRIGFASVAILFAWYFYREVWRDRIIIEPFNMPQRLVDAGYTPEVFANRVGDQLRRIAAHIQRNMDDLTPGSEDNSIPDVEIPGTKLDLKTIVNVVQELLDLSPQRVGGDVTVANQTSGAAGQAASISYAITTSSTRGRIRHTARATVTDGSIDTLVRQAAEMALQEVNPRLYAMHLLRQQRYDQTMAFVHQTMQDPSSTCLDRVAALNLWGSVLAAQRQYDDAAIKYERAIALAPKDAAAYSDLGIVRRAQHREEEAAKLYDYAIRLDSRDTLAYNNWGVLLRGQKKYDEAIAKYREAIALDPQNAMAYFNWANLLLAQNHVEEAIAGYQKTIALDPDYTLAYDHWGNAVAAQGNLPQAASHYAKAIEIDPRNPAAYSDWGVLLETEGKHDEAIGMYQRAIEIDVNYANAYINWGDLLKAQGQTIAANAMYQRAQAITSGH